MAGAETAGSKRLKITRKMQRRNEENNGDRCIEEGSCERTGRKSTRDKL